MSRSGFKFFTGGGGEGEVTKHEWGEKREWEEQLLQEWLRKIHRWEEEQDREEKRGSDEKQEWKWLQQLHRGGGGG